MALRNVSAPSMTMTADVFPSYHLTVSAASPGSVIRNPIHEGDSYACSDVQLKAKPTYLFQNWSGDVTDTAANPIAVHVDAPKQVTALFASSYRPLPEFAMQNLVAACQTVACPPFQVQDGKWIVNPSPNEKFKAISRGRDAKAKKATKIKKEVSQLAKKMGSASSSKQKKAEKRAGELVKELEQVGATN